MHEWQCAQYGFVCGLILATRLNASRDRIIYIVSFHRSTIPNYFRLRSHMREKSKSFSLKSSYTHFHLSLSLSLARRCIISRYAPRYIKRRRNKDRIERFPPYRYRYPSRNGIFDQILASNLVSNGDKGSVQPLSEALTAGYLGMEEGERYTKREKLPDARHPNDSVSESISSYELVGCGPISHP